MTDIQERTTFKFVSLISIEELSMRLVDSTRGCCVPQKFFLAVYNTPYSTRVFDTSSVQGFVLQSLMHTTLEEECVKVSLDLRVVHPAPSSAFTGRLSCRDAATLLKRTNLLSCITDYGVNDVVFISGVLFVFSARPHRVLCLTLTRNTEKKLAWPNKVASWAKTGQKKNFEFLP